MNDIGIGAFSNNHITRIELVGQLPTTVGFVAFGVNHLQIDELLALGFDYFALLNQTPPCTCTNPGCGHDYVWEEITPPCCDDYGLEAGICQWPGCDHETTRDVPPLSCDFSDNWFIYRAPTFTEPGEERNPCQHGCGRYETREIAVLELEPPDCSYCDDEGCDECAVALGLYRYVWVVYVFEDVDLDAAEYYLGDVWTVNPTPLTNDPLGFGDNFAREYRVNVDTPYYFTRLANVNDKNDVFSDSANTYEFRGWRIYVDNELTDTYLIGKDLLDPNGTFYIPSLQAIAAVAAAGYIGIEPIWFDGLIELHAIWGIASTEDTPPTTTPPAGGLPGTGVDGNTTLWTVLIAIALLVATGTVLWMKKVNKETE